MRALTPALLTSFAGRSGPGRAVKITRRDGTVLRLIEAMSSMTIGAQTWVPGTGLIVGSLPFAASEEATSLDLDVVAVAGGVIDIADVHAGIYRGATVEVFLFNRLTPADGLGALFVGTIGQINVRGLGRVTMEAIGPLGRMAQSFAHKWSPTCRWLFGDSNCGIDIDALSDAATVASVSGGFALTLSGATGDAAHWDMGHIHVESGLMEGFDFEIRTWAPPVATLFLPVAELIGAGASVTLYPGCTYQIGEAGGCAVRWSNALNFGGEPYMPGSTGLPVGGTGVLSPTGQAWSPEHVAGGYLSNNNTTATGTVYAGGAVRGARGRSAGKYMFSYEPSTSGGGLFHRVGIINESATTNWTLAESWEWWGYGVAHMDDPYGYTVCVGSWTAGDVLDIVVDLDNRKLYHRKNNGGWNGDSVANNPTTGTGGIDISGLEGTIYPYNRLTTNSSGTANFAGPFEHALPSGVLPWDS